MGKKNKVGKSRKDKFYHLAKETGFRARSAFKLLQLNRKFEFLQKSRVCIDLCAAPGGWLQVAAQQMPVSSLIIGVDLVPIKPIPHTTTFQADITTEKCRQQLKKEMQTWKADVVLHDGAPNVGKNWVHDAFAQAELTLQALKLATEFLRKGGCFVTKVFRSKDYHALLWVFGQLFKKVHATKPQASRNESAEIFVVCQFYREPDKIDPKFLDPKYVFKEVNDGGKMPLNLIHPEKVKKRTEGYADGDYTCYQKVNVSDFIEAENHTEILAECSEIVIDVDDIANHKLTTAEIKECCKDIKVLGKKELRNILNWRKKMKTHMDSLKQENGEEVESDTEEMEVVNEEENHSDNEDEEGNLDQQIADIYDEERREAKRQRKKVMKEKRKLRDKMSLNMIIPGDVQDITDDVNLFDLKRIKNKQNLSAASKDDMEEGRSESESEDEEFDPKKKKQMMKYDRYASEQNDGDDVMPSSDEDEELEMESEDDDDDEVESDDEAEKNPLVLDLEAKDAKTKRKTEMWFNKDVFNDLEDEADEDLEIEKMTEEYKKKGGTIIEKKSDKKKKQKKQVDSSSDEDSDSGHGSDNHFSGFGMEDSDSDSDSDSDDSDYDADKVMQKSLTNSGKGQKRAHDKNGFEIVPAGQTGKKIRKLDPVGLAIGEELVKSSKRRREIIENSYNRYTFNDDNLPDWFAKEERKHNKPQLPVSKEQIQEYKEKQKAIDARPIRKIAEAKGRKKRKMSKKLEKARKKAEVISETVDVTDKEKMQQIKQIYKKAGLLKKKKEDITYVVAKRGTGKRVRRPAGVKGQFKVVDPRMKKDELKRKKTLKATKGGRKKAPKGKSRK